MSVRIRSGVGVLVRAATWTLVAAVAAVLAAVVLVPRLGGGTPYVILTGSMGPDLPPGTVVVTRPVRGTPAVGTVITYQRASGEPGVVTHRVVARGISATGEPVVRTRGDANPVADVGWVRPVQIRGERWYDVPYIGHLATILSDATRRTATTATAVALLLYAAVLLLAGLRERVGSRPVAR